VDWVSNPAPEILDAFLVISSNIFSFLGKYHKIRRHYIEITLFDFQPTGPALAKF